MMTQISNILIVDDDENARKNMSRHLELKGYNISSAKNITDATVYFSRNNFDVVVTDMIMDEDKAGLTILKMAISKNPSTRVIIITAYNNLDDAFNSARGLAFAYLSKNHDDPYKELCDKVKDALSFDAFISYKSNDMDKAMALSRLLQSHGLRIWIDQQNILPGQSFQNELQKAIPLCKSALIIFGSKGIGKWQQTEIETLNNLSKSRGIPLIPVLLPGVKKIPENMIFLNNYNWIKLNPCLNTGCSISQLLAGITGKKIVKHQDFL